MKRPSTRGDNENEIRNREPKEDQKVKRVSAAELPKRACQP